MYIKLASVCFIRVVVCVEGTIITYATNYNIVVQTLQIKSQMKNSHASCYVANCINIQAVTVKAKTWQEENFRVKRRECLRIYKHFAVACL